MSVMSAILEKEPEAISTINPLTPPLLDHIVRRCLAKIPDERWGSGAVFSGLMRGDLLRNSLGKILGALAQATPTLLHCVSVDFSP